ncbi:hypothetical protein MKC91_11155 [[Clostridium] innocuum]|nr:hypothetical protein [Erysipelotrichaceae bacterium]MCR0380940.1 hypothetical protein [[Clostridium] innocuum]MCR0411423.1 hypothetical protein [[Clostridium] innocuum]MCR0534990.1 hypothetical protein [[Clostridium] innocuum]MCR0538960.1 hypothetical protein [[Clostridium] innocuum]
MKKNVKAVTCAALSMMLVNSGMVLYAKDDETVKDETVYAMLNSDGSVDQEIVSSWLHNDNGIRDIKEVLDLNNVKNVKSDEKPEVSGKTYTWNSASNDVYYEGTSTKTLPVQVKVSYKLDGKDISGKDLIGKSGKLEIHISLKNTQSKTVNVNGRQTRIHPFYMGAGVLDLSTDHFSNVKCENGKILSEGNNTMVAFVSVPGLQDTLESSGMEVAKDLHIQDEFTITCDAKEFELGPIMFAMTPEVPVDKLKNINSMDDLTNGLDELTNASAQLLDGTSQLSQGTATFNGKMQELVNGVPTLTNGVSALKNGTTELVSGSSKLYSGLKDLNTGMNQAKAGTAKLNKATDGLGTLVSGVDEINTNMQALAKGLQDGSNELNASLTDEMLKSLTQSLGNVSALQTVFENDQKNVAQAAAELEAALTSADVDNAAGKLGETAEYLKKKAFNDENKVVDAEAAQALQSLQSADDYLSDYKKQATASAVNLKKQLTQLQTDSANLKNLSDMASSAAKMLPKLSSLKASMNTASQGAQQLAQGTQQLSEKSSTLLELKKGISTLDSSMTTAVGGSSELYKGSQALVSGLQRVDRGAGTLQSGSATIGNGAQQLYAASTLLKDKTGELHAGMSKFKTTGIDEMQKQVTLSLDDVTQLLAIKDEIVKEAEQEHTFSGAPKNSESKVKYIYKTEELQKEKKTDIQETKKTKEEAKDDFFDKISNFFSKMF